jgi:hypothetical protein
VRDLKTTKAERRGYKSAPPEVWTVATKTLNPDDMEAMAYRVVGRKSIIPGPDYMELTEEVAQSLHDIGQICQPISAFNAALSAFSINLFFTSDNSEIGDIAQPAHPYRDDLSIYGLDALFVASEDCIACKITLYDSNDASAGDTDVGVVLLYDCGPEGFHVVPYAMDAFGTSLYDYKSITGISHWLGYLWRGVQYHLSNRPELVRVKHTRIKKDIINDAKNRTKGSKQIVKVQRIITITAEAHEKTVGRKHSITIPVWGVSGHWRTYRSGKCIWIRPYYKGKDRHTQKTYCPKEYRFVREVLE